MRLHPRRWRYPLLPNLDIWRTANLLIRYHGDRAEAVAAHQINETIDRNDLDLQLLWLRIRDAIAMLRAKPTQPLH